MIRPLPTLVLINLLAIPVSAAQADRGAAEACAARLPPPAQAIFQAVIDKVLAGEAIANLVRAQSQFLIRQGRLALAEKDLAESGAVACLKLATASSPPHELTFEEYQRMHRRQIEVK